MRPSPTPHDPRQRIAGNVPKLVLALQAKLAGVVESMVSVRLPGRATEGVVLAFKDAKFAVVAYDADRHDLETLSLHQFEDTDVQVRIRTAPPCPPQPRPSARSPAPLHLPKTDNVREPVPASAGCGPAEPLCGCPYLRRTPGGPPLPLGHGGRAFGRHRSRRWRGQPCRVHSALSLRSSSRARVLT